MRTLGLLCAFALVLACGDDDAVPPQTVDRSLLDAGVVHSAIDASQAHTSVDAAPLAPPCMTLDVCAEDSKPGLLYNVCIAGAAGAVSEPACLVDPNGVLYLAPLAPGQQVMNRGWTQSNGTLRAADQARCDMARAALLRLDASMPPKCAGQ